MNTILIISLLTVLAALITAAVMYGKWKAADSEVRLLRLQLDDLRANDERFRAMAADVLRQNSSDLLNRSNAGISALLQPLRENISKFQQDITDYYSNEARERFALDDRIRQLLDISQGVGSEARRLADALKGNNKVQGDWGEMVLESILTRAGLHEGREFITQQTIIDHEGRRLRPDVVLNMPDGRCIVIDSKVSMKAYFDLRDAVGNEQIQAAQKALLLSVKNHISELKQKKYQDIAGKRRADMVLMFIPHEGAYLAAVEAEPDLCQMAFDCRVLMVSPTHLMAVLSLADQLWRQADQEQNAAEIAEQAGRMLDKFKGFIDDMQRIDRSMKTSREAFDNAMVKLSEGKGNLISRAESLRMLGTRSKKQL